MGGAPTRRLRASPAKAARPSSPPTPGTAGRGASSGGRGACDQRVGAWIFREGRVRRRVGIGLRSHIYRLKAWKSEHCYTHGLCQGDGYALARTTFRC